MGREPIVFIVDSDPSARESLAMILGPKGFAVEAYASAEQFLEAFDRSRCGCLVVDVQLPGMDGLELQEYLRAVGISLPVIVVAARATVRMAVRAIRGGAVNFLEKPYRDCQLSQTIHKAIEQHRRNLAREAQEARPETRLAKGPSKAINARRRHSGH